MSKSTCTLVVSLAFTASLFCLSAVANTPPVPTPSKTVTPEITFDCKFDGGGSDKGGSWFKRCHAEGTLTPIIGVMTDGESHLKVICDDGDDDQDNHDHPLFDGPASSRFDRDDETLIIKGLKTRDDDRRAPVVTVFDIEQKDLCPPTRPERNDERRFSSQIQFDQEGNDFILTGRCEFKCNTPPPLN